MKCYLQHKERNENNKKKWNVIKKKKEMTILKKNENVDKTI